MTVAAVMYVMYKRTQYVMIKNRPSATNSAKAEGQRCVCSANAIKIQSYPYSFPQSNHHLLDVVK